MSAFSFCVYFFFNLIRLMWSLNAINFVDFFFYVRRKCASYPKVSTAAASFAYYKKYKIIKMGLISEFYFKLMIMRHKILP